MKKKALWREKRWGEWRGRCHQLNKHLTIEALPGLYVVAEISGPHGACKKNSPFALVSERAAGMWRPQPDLNRCCRRERPFERDQGSSTQCTRRLLRHPASPRANL